MSESRKTRWTLTARWIIPVAGPPLEGGLLTIEAEKIAGVEPRSSRGADLDLGNVALLPGLVNAHVHLDLSGLRGLQPTAGADFTDWLRAVVRQRRELPAEQIKADIRAGLTECLAAGTTLLGDISGQGLSLPILESAPLRSVVFYELLGLPEDRARRDWTAAQAALRSEDSASRHGESRAESQESRAEKSSTAHRSPLTTHHAQGTYVPRSGASARTPLTPHHSPLTPNCRLGLSPHAPYSVCAALFQKTAEEARVQALAVAVHLAETRAELELLEHQSGPFVRFLEELGVWEPAGLVAGPEDILKLFADVAPVLWIHANYLDPALPIARGGTVIYCPRTHAAFGHAAHPFRDFLARGVRVALGTDSLASNPDLDVLAEARFLHQCYPEVPGDVLIRFITLSGAEALGWADETGSLEPGKSADLVVVPLPDEDATDPNVLVLESSAPVQAVLWRGEWRNG